MKKSPVKKTPSRSAAVSPQKARPKKSGSASAAAPPQLALKTRSGRKTLGVPEAFALAHRMLIRGNLEAAGQIIEWLDGVLPNDRCVAVLRARAAARTKNYDECSRILSRSFGGDSDLGNLPGPLHTAIVYRAVGLYPSAKKELLELCQRFPELPSLWLLAGDLWLALGRPDKAIKSWKEAIRNDYPAKLITAAATRRIQETSGRCRR